MEDSNGGGGVEALPEAGDSGSLTARRPAWSFRLTGYRKLG